MNEPASSAGSSLSMDALIHSLREAGLALGASEVLDATRLVARLATGRVRHARAQELKPYLRAVFCKRVEDAAAFNDGFERWLSSTDVGPIESPGSTASSKESPAGRSGSKWLAVMVSLLSAALIIGGALWARRSYPPLIPDVRPALDPVVEPKSSPVAPVVASPVTETELEERYFPAIRQNRELRPGWVVVVLAPLLFGLVLVGVPAALLTKRRGGPGRKVQLDTRKLEAQARSLVPSVHPDAAARLSRHIRGRSIDPRRLARRPAIDVRGSVQATAMNLGVPTLRYRHAAIRPSYLMLIDGDIETDPRARLFYEWAKRLMHEGWDVEIRGFRRAPLGVADAPRIYRAESSGWSESRAANLPLDHLEDPPVGQRLLILSDGACLANERGGLLPWTQRARFKRWRERVVFTPVQMRFWGEREMGIEQRESAADPGFLVLPLDEPALDAWSLSLVTGTLSTFTLSEPERYPASLTHREAEACDPSKPLRGLDTLIAELKLYLGDTGFRWLAALAVPPLIRWELTLLIGTALVHAQRAKAGAYAGLRSVTAARALLVSRNYRRLTQLPWLRKSVAADGKELPPGIPDWLRLRLVHELPEVAATQVREAVRSALASAGPRPGASGLELALDLPAEPGYVGPNRGEQQKGDALYVGYLSGLSARELELCAPAAWAPWLNELNLPQHGAGIPALARRLSERIRAARSGSSSRGNLGREWIGVIAGALLGWAVALGIVMAAGPGQLPSSFEQAFFVQRDRGVGAGKVTAAAMAFKDDSTRLFIMDIAGTGHTIDARSGVELKTWRGPNYVVETARFSQNGELVLTSCSEAMDVWSSESGAWVGGLARGKEPFTSPVMSADGSTIATAGGATVFVYKLRERAEPRKIELDSAPLQIVLNATGSRLAYRSATDVGIVDATLGTYLRREPVAWKPQQLQDIRKYVPQIVMLDRDGGRVAFTADETFRVHDVASGERLIQIPRPSLFDEVAWHSDRGLLAVETSSGVGLWTVANPTQPRVLELSSSNVLSSLSFNRDGTLLAAVGSQGVTLWSTSTGAPILGVENNAWAEDVSFSADSSALVVANDEMEPATRLWLRGTRVATNSAWSGPEAIKSLFASDAKGVGATIAGESARGWTVYVLLWLSDWKWSVPAFSSLLLLAILGDKALFRRWSARQGHG
jgi:uncharacterized protein with von Willebrand factor type A (vWA) domain